MTLTLIGCSASVSVLGYRNLTDVAGITQILTTLEQLLAA